MGARAYSPELARFTTPDPQGTASTWNEHGAFSGDPVNLIDPDGAIAIAAGAAPESGPLTIYPAARAAAARVAARAEVKIAATFATALAIDGILPGGVGNGTCRPPCCGGGMSAGGYIMGGVGGGVVAGVGAHIVLNARKNSLPRTGPPNSTSVIDRGNGKGQIRDYGPLGEAVLESISVMITVQEILTLTTGSTRRDSVADLSRMAIKETRLPSSATYQFKLLPDQSTSSAYVALRRVNSESLFVLLTALDSDREPSKTPTGTAIASEHRAIATHGGALFFEAAIFDAFVADGNLNGFDEFWLFDSQPLALDSSPTSITTDRPRLDESALTALMRWCDSTRPLVGFGDGDELQVVYSSDLAASIAHILDELDS